MSDSFLADVTPLGANEVARVFAAERLSPPAEEQARIAYAATLLARLTARVAAWPIAGESEPAHSFSQLSDHGR